MGVVSGAVDNCAHSGAGAVHLIGFACRKNVLVESGGTRQRKRTISIGHIQQEACIYAAAIRYTGTSKPQLSSLNAFRMDDRHMQRPLRR